jgi:hypothetical protein
MTGPCDSFIAFERWMTNKSILCVGFSVFEIKIQNSNFGHFFLHSTPQRGHARFTNAFRKKTCAFFLCLSHRLVVLPDFALWCESH